MKLSTKKTICVRPQVNMAMTTLARMKNTEKQSATPEGKSYTGLNKK
jgi:hypothetical protein